uniref:Uncharacterized protein n=1 Tax=Arundo donax TaxID=35708 RepID=A0A0A9G416_ARUDO
MPGHSEGVPICSPQAAPSASACDMGKMEEIMDQQRTFEVDTSNASVNQSPQSNQDIDCEFPSPTPRSENKEPAVDNSGLTPASPGNLTATYSPVYDTCKMEITNQQKNT